MAKSFEQLVPNAPQGRFDSISRPYSPAEVEKFVAKQPNLEEADVWLSSAVTQSTFGLAAVLDQFGPKMLAEALANLATSAVTPLRKSADGRGRSSKT